MDDLLRYYEEELAGFRREAADFAKRYPKIASRLDLSANESTDPHVERLIESVALLCTRARLRAEAKLPALAQSALQILYPDLACPVPAMSIARMSLDAERGRFDTGFRVTRGTQLSSRPVAGEVYRFRTCFDVDLWPLTVAGLAAVPVKSGAAIDLRLSSDADLRLEAIESLTIHLTGFSSFRLYELLAAHVDRLEVWDGGKKISRDGEPGAVEVTGFEDDQAALPGTRQTFSGLRILREYLSLPEKFLFLKLRLPKLRESIEIAKSQSFSIRLYMKPSAGRVERDLDQNVIHLGCTPVINLFPQIAEPVMVTQQKAEYLVIPDIHRRRSMEIYSIDEVATMPVDGSEPRKLLPLYGQQATGGSQGGFWTLRRSAPSLPDDPMDTYLGLADLPMEPGGAASDVLTVRATCTNVNNPSRMAWGSEMGDLAADDSPGSFAISRVVLLRRPTPRLLPPLGGRTERALISHMALQHLSLSEDGAGVLRRLLQALDATEQAATARQIEAIVNVVTRREIAHLYIGGARMPVPGTHIEVGLDEEAFVGGGAYLFGAVLDRFLSLYASLNTFTQLRVTSRQRREAVGNWPPRAGIQAAI
ncbi:MAG TPA: type VI secretion system baseplate subunit TssF [Candidatus Sulfopaludibacter sp.]|jgi:type VI secretion system protein ImpG|nr:type VI secretion system baseplate subunit TssF [Candidatus Sulfopaludibacter sp.]